MTSIQAMALGIFCCVLARLLTRLLPALPLTLLHQALCLGAQAFYLVQQSLAIVAGRSLLVPVLHRLLCAAHIVLQTIEGLGNRRFSRRHLTSITLPGVSGGFLQLADDFVLLRFAGAIPQAF